MPTFTIPVTPPDSNSPASTPPQYPPAAPHRANPSPPRTSSPESHPDCDACKSRSPSPPPPQPQPKRKEQPKPAAETKPKSTPDPSPAETQSPKGFVANLLAFAENNPVLRGLIALPLAILFILYSPQIFTSLSPYHYLFPESFPPEPPHPDDFPANVGIARDAIASQIEAAMFRAAGAGAASNSLPSASTSRLQHNSPFSPAPHSPAEPISRPAEVPQAPGPALPNPAEALKNQWITFPTYLLLQFLLTIVSSGPLRRLTGYWASRPLHIRGTRAPVFPEEALPTLDGVDPSERIMTAWFFLHPRRENFTQIFQAFFLVMLCFCGMDSLSLGEFGSWMAETGLGKLVPLCLVVYVSLVLVVLGVNQYVIIKAVVSDVVSKIAQVIWTLVRQWGAFLGSVFWTVQGVTVVGLAVLSGLVMYTVAMPWDDEVWEAIRARVLVTASASLMGIADVLFDWAGVGVRSVVADFWAASGRTCGLPI